jgi:hypothetical protein
LYFTTSFECGVTFGTAADASVDVVMMTIYPSGPTLGLPLRA